MSFENALELRKKLNEVSGAKEEVVDGAYEEADAVMEEKAGGFSRKKCTAAEVGLPMKRIQKHGRAIQKVSSIFRPTLPSKVIEQYESSTSILWNITKDLETY